MNVWFFHYSDYFYLYLFYDNFIYLIILVLRPSNLDQDLHNELSRSEASQPP